MGLEESDFWGTFLCECRPQPTSKKCLGYRQGFLVFGLLGTDTLLSQGQGTPYGT